MLPYTVSKLKAKPCVKGIYSNDDLRNTTKITDSNLKTARASRGILREDTLRSRHRRLLKTDCVLTLHGFDSFTLSLL